MKLKSMMAAAAVASVALAPVAASAGTSAAASMPKVTAPVGARTTSAVASKSKVSGGTLVLAGLGLGAAIWGATELFGSDDNKSTGS